MTTAINQVLNAIRQSPIALTANAIKEMEITHPAYVRKILLDLYEAGKVRRFKSKASRQTKAGKMPYAYYIPNHTSALRDKVLAAQEPKAETSKVQIVVGEYTLTVSQARALYAQLQELFSN